MISKKVKSELKEIACNIKIIEGIIQLLKQYNNVDTDYIDILEQNSYEAKSKLALILNDYY